MSQRDYVEKDYYRTLGVDDKAEQADVAKAYRKLARELHPDANPDSPDAETRFKEVSEAYSVLSNPEKRAEYDKVRQLVGSGAFGGGVPGGGFPPPGGGFGGTGGAQAFDLSDLLGGLFGQAGGAAGPAARGRQRTAARGRDLETDLTLSFADAMAGVTTTLRISGNAVCSTCGGSRARPGTTPTTCEVCRGTGAIARDQGMFSFSEPCDTCGGRGQVIPEPCTVCGGSGVERRPREIRARIPAGVKDGTKIRLKGKGEPAPLGGGAGDLFVNVHVAAHDVFERKGDDLLLRVPVTFAEAALGTKVTVPTLDGSVTLKVPAGTEPGRTLRVRGRGAPGRKGGQGDLLVTVDIAVPRKLTRTQRKLLEDFAATENDDLRAHLDDFVAQASA
ncbi:molecular chaperone DnaJ [soil metagenome]